MRVGDFGERGEEERVDYVAVGDEEEGKCCEGFEDDRHYVHWSKYSRKDSCSKVF